MVEITDGKETYSIFSKEEAPVRMLGENSVWIENSGGEGMETEFALFNCLDTFFKENF